ncbi:MAG: ribosome silencing factor [Candidatus Fischerbacteria bacterium RBG_13_37_8]|uniref:Ribosomal silencing factor RsfS n=1 Tax=Candidatus Fischerbacteria bacterium RBG_13_37_8 TaxID=1817863 RepID=A0A1F5VVA1_9BACT|nr:MAG: ribosome silencing factor [Candidatus Fischerbacteria bacterium RBG_13_37_8]
MQQNRLPKKIKIAAEAAYQKKAENIVILSLKSLSVFTDYFMICQGNSEPQIQAITESIERALSSLELEPHHVEGLGKKQWILMDYQDFVVHVFLPEVRFYYELEKLWGDAEKYYYNGKMKKTAGN